MCGQMLCVWHVCEGMCVLCMWVCVGGYVCGHPAKPFKEMEKTIGVHTKGRGVVCDGWGRRGRRLLRLPAGCYPGRGVTGGIFILKVTLLR